METNEELYDLENIKHQKQAVHYRDVEDNTWIDSPTTPKASTSSLQDNKDLIMLLFADKSDSN
jgi:hypothetical protein